MVAENSGSALAPLLSEVLHEYHPALPYMVMGMFGVGAPLLGLVLPETRGRPTRDRYEDFFVKPSDGGGNSGNVDNEGIEMECPI